MNATRAYKAAYPNIKKDDVAAASGARLLRNVKIKKYIDEQLEQIKSEKIADATEVMQYLTSVLRGKAVGEEIVVEFVGDGVSEARRVNKNPSEKEKLKAAELLGKRYGIFTDKVELTAVVPVIDGEDSLED